MEIKVPIRCKGHITVCIPECAQVPETLQEKLAHIYALNSIVVTNQLLVDEKLDWEEYVEIGGSEDDWHSCFIADVDVKGMVIRPKGIQDDKKGNC